MLDISYQSDMGIPMLSSKVPPYSLKTSRRSIIVGVPEIRGADGAMSPTNPLNSVL